tara:strand:- start:2970 stop:3827 length:858 start_codon:yes stop_codon:yes gene_type:complete
MKLHSVEAGNFKLDGGAMFGVVPKSIWQRTNPADSNNMIQMSCRCLLIEESSRLILIDTGMGDKQSEKFFRYYYRWGDFSLVSSLNSLGFSCDDITDIFLTHLHFDHCGGGTVWAENKKYLKPLFKNATYWSNESHWDWACNPNAREKASFLSENLLPLKESGQLKFISNHKSGFEFKPELGFDVLFVNGHTEKQMIPQIDYKGKKIVFAADLIPTAGHLPIPYIMSYDTKPLLSMDEKSDFLKEGVENECLLVLEHDPYNEVISLKKTEKGVRLDRSFKFHEIF